MMHKVRSRAGFDRQLLWAVGALIAFGLIALTSASSVLAFDKFRDNFYFIKHQILFGLLPGLGVFLLVSRVSYDRMRRLALPIFACALLLLVLVLIPGVGVKLGGARSWFHVFGVSFQPAELAKLAFILYLAAWLEKKGQAITDWKQGFGGFLIIAGVLLGLIALQPDVGTMIIVAAIAACMFFAAGGRWAHMGILLLGGVLAIFLLIKAAPYRAERFLTFLDPSRDPQGQGYQITQALIAVGSGGMFGVGLGHSRQKFRYLPEVTGDSIFAIVAEELGFFLSSGLIVLFAWFVLRVLRVASNAHDDFGRYVAIGIGAWIGIQAIVNIGAMINVLPLTGLPLPFISYGGSSLMTLLAAVGVLVSIARGPAIHERR